jgi:hypothetical protein
MKTGFFTQEVELKIQRKNPGSALWLHNHVVASVASVMEGYWLGLLAETITCLVVDGHSLAVKLTTVCCCCWCEGI